MKRYHGRRVIESWTPVGSHPISWIAQSNYLGRFYAVKKQTYKMGGVDHGDIYFEDPHQALLFILSGYDYTPA